MSTMPLLNNIEAHLTEQAVEGNPTLVWVSSIKPDLTMDAATWLDTTAELRALGWQVTLLAVGPRSLTAVRGIQVRCLPWPKRYILGPLIYHLNVILFLLRRWRQVDVILFHDISAIWLFPLRGLRALLGQSRPLFVMDVRDLVDYAPTMRIRIRLWFFHKIIFPLANYLTDSQTAITPRMADMVGIAPTQRLGYWPSGVDPKKFATAWQQREWPTPGAPIELIYIGNMLAKRNLVPLSHAVIRATQAGMNLRLNLYGGGPAQRALAEVAAQSNGVVHVHPPVPHQQVPELLAMAHVGVTSLPSTDDIKYQASSPVKLFEYMAAGMPMLSTKNVCHTEVVGDGAYVFWTESPSEDDLYRALETLWQHHAQLAHLGAQANAMAERWSWAAAARKLSDALLRCVQEHPKA